VRTLGDAADEDDEQRVRAAERPLAADEHGQHHRGDQTDARIEQDADEHRRERDRHELRSWRRHARDRRRRREHDDEGDGEEDHDAHRRVHLRPEEQQRDAEDDDDHEVVQHRAGHACRRARRRNLGATALLRRVPQRAHLLVRFASDDFVRVDDLLPRAHEEAIRIDALRGLGAQALGRRAVGQQRRVEEGAQQLTIQRVADVGVRVGMHRASARQQSVERHDAVEGHDRHAPRLRHTDLPADARERRRRGNAAGQIPIEHAADGVELRATSGRCTQIRDLGWR
jgi:hypothetical protein